MGYAGLVNAPYPPIRVEAGFKVTGKFHAVEATNGDCTFGAATMYEGDKQPIQDGDVLLQEAERAGNFTVVENKSGSSGVMLVYASYENYADVTPVAA